MDNLARSKTHRRQYRFDVQNFQEQRASKRKTWHRSRSKRNSDIAGILVSGGLDSAILLKQMLDAGHRVKPLYVQSGLCWQAAEQRIRFRFRFRCRPPYPPGGIPWSPHLNRYLNPGSQLRLVALAGVVRMAAARSPAPVKRATKAVAPMETEANRVLNSHRM